MHVKPWTNPLSTMQYVTCGQAQTENWNERFGENLQNGFKQDRKKKVKHDQRCKI